VKARDAFPVGARVLWDGDEFTVWAAHPKKGYRWIMRDGADRPLAASVKNLTVVGHAATPTQAPAPPYEPRTHARATDPDTSVAGARDVKVRAGTQMARLLAAYADFGTDGCTDHQASLRAGLSHTGYWKRCADLRDAGLIEDTGARVMGHQGSHVMTCRITDKGQEVHRGA
jgi:hypothetical protein